MLTDTIATDRLDLVPLRVGHAEEMSDVLSGEALYAFIGGVAPTPDELRFRYELMIAGSPDPLVTWLNWVLRLRSDDSLVGTVQATLSAGPRGHVAEIAWVVGIPWQGRGFATEAARALVAWFGTRPVPTVIAHVHPAHHASAAVAAAAGLTATDQRHEGETRWELTVTP